MINLKGYKQLACREAGRMGVMGMAGRALQLVKEKGLAGFVSYIRLSAAINIIGTETGAPSLKGKEPARYEKVRVDKLGRLSKSKLPGGALLVGHAFGTFGLGEHIRSAASAFDSAGIPFHVQNAWGDLGSSNLKLFDNFNYSDKLTSDARHKVNVFFMNANEMKAAHSFLGKEFFKDKYNIGYWAWELPHFPDQWLDSFNYVDEVWAMSRFVQQSIAERAPCPVVHMPLTIDMKSHRTFDREYFGLPENKFIFLFFFDFTSYMARKNPQAAIEAYRKAFQNDSSKACLVIKMSGVEQHQEEYNRLMTSRVLDDMQIITMGVAFEDSEIQGLLQVCDCFISLHRSEGFGRGIAEAMLCGKPVIATGYSGNLDFTNERNSCLVNYKLIAVKDGEYPYGKDQVWADPDTDQAAWYMQKLVAEPVYASNIGRSAAEYIRINHSAAAIGSRYRSRLEELGLL